MKRIWIFLFLFTGIKVNGQNLVPNPSFEIPISCIHDINYCLAWHNPTAYSPDYLNSCIGGTSYSVPVNYYGYQPARTGTAYAGIILEFRGAVGSSREYIQAQLLDSLTSGKKYLVSFYTCISDSTSFAVNDIGAFFSDSAISSNLVTYLPFQPQVSNNPFTNPLIQKNVWIQVEDSFIAQGGEKYITIGNFKDDANTDTTSVSSGSIYLNYSYYYIDDVSVTLIDSINSTIEIAKPDTESIFFEHADYKIKIFSNNIMKHINLFDEKGSLIFDAEPNSKTFEKFCYNIGMGIYFVQIEYQNFTSYKKLAIY